MYLYKNITQNKDKFILKLPRFTLCEDEVIKALKNAKEHGFNAVQINNIAHISIAKEYGFIMHGGFSLTLQTHFH